MLRDTLLSGLPTLLRDLNLSLQARPVDVQTLPDALVREWRSANGRYRLDVVPAENINDDHALRRFAAAVQGAAPAAAGAPIEYVGGARSTIASSENAASTAWSGSSRARTTTCGANAAATEAAVAAESRQRHAPEQRGCRFHRRAGDPRQPGRRQPVHAAQPGAAHCRPQSGPVGHADQPHRAAADAGDRRTAGRLREPAPAHAELRRLRTDRALLPAALGGARRPARRRRGEKRPSDQRARRRADRPDHARQPGQSDRRCARYAAVPGRRASSRPRRGSNGPRRSKIPMPRRPPTRSRTRRT